MKLAAITDEISQDFEHALDVLSEYGGTGAELRGLWGTNIADLDQDQAERAKKALKQRGIEVCCLASPFYKCDLYSDEAAVAGRMHLAQARRYDDQFELLDRLITLADFFETRMIRIFTFWRRQEMNAEIEQRIIEAVASAVEVAERRNVVLCLENEHACYVGTGAETARVVSAIPSECLAVCWDPGNALAAGEVPYPDGYLAVRDRIAHVHVKDAVLKDGKPEWCVVGSGIIDYRGHLSALHDAGYKGYVSLETHYIPQGGTPEDGSRPSLASLDQLLKDGQKDVP